jgi:hypothetical protein
MEKRRPSSHFVSDNNEEVEIKRMRTLGFVQWRRYPQGTCKFEVAHKSVLLGRLVLRWDEGER